MKKSTVIIVVIQIILLAFVAGKREWIIAKGEQVYLKTAPVDPRDIFRGDYVRLDYEIAQPNVNLINEPLKTKDYRVIYASLIKDERGIGEITHIGFEQPDGLFIKGYLNDKNISSWRNRGRIKFGIEKYFVEQGEGISIEKIRGRASQWQSSMEMDVNLGSDGTAVIKGFRWSDMGVRLEMLEPGERVNNNIPGENNINANSATNRATTRVSPKLRISVKNQSKQSISFADSAGHCAFQLLENKTVDISTINSTKLVALPNRQCNDNTSWTMHTLKPEEIYSIEVDMAHRVWFVKRDDKLTELGRLPVNRQGYRWSYKLPDSVIKQNKNNQTLWKSTLRTARFNANRRID